MLDARYQFHKSQTSPPSHEASSSTVPLSQISTNLQTGAPTSERQDEKLSSCAALEPVADDLSLQQKYDLLKQKYESLKRTTTLEIKPSVVSENIVTSNSSAEEKVSVKPNVVHIKLVTQRSDQQKTESLNAR